MRKSELPHRKNAAADRETSQKKISTFFSKAAKNESSSNKDSITNVTSHVCTDGAQRKRKLSEHSVLQELPSKATKYDSTSDACYIKTEKLDHTINEHNKRTYVINNVSPKNKIKTNKDKEQVKKVSVSLKRQSLENKLMNYKENVNIPEKTLCETNAKSIDPLVEDIELHGITFDEDFPYVRTNTTQASNASMIIDKHFDNAALSDCSTGIITNSKKLGEVEKLDLDDALDMCNMDDFNELFEDDWSTDTYLNLSTLQRCKVTDVKRECKATILTVEQEEFGATAIVACSGFWRNICVETNHIVVIQAKQEGQTWIVDNNNGFLVVKPDVLISGTTIVGGLFCSRRAVLQEKFRKIESLPYYASDQTAMTVGSLVHQLLQRALRKNINKEDDVVEEMDSILQSRDTMVLLYASEMKYNDCRQQMLSYVPKVFEFIQHYVKDKKQQTIGNMRQNFKGTITQIRDIEENIWLPKLGVKGKIDVTVEVNVNSRRKIMPLEVKTGRPSFSLEHKGQIILYILMMALTGQDTDTGLLLYLRENSMQEIRSGHPERRDLILLRNTLANYFVSKSTESFSESECQPIELPEPINHPTACGRCPYNTLCCTYLSRDNNMHLSESHPLTALSKEILRNLKPAHIDYVIKWISLMQMEESVESADNKLKDIWTLAPEKRETKGICICHLKVIGKVMVQGSKYQHTLVRTNTVDGITSNSIPCANFVENEYVIVSTDIRINISAGFIACIKDDSVSVLLDRDITKYHDHGSFHIDKYSSSSLCSFNLANVGGLLADNEICEKLRSIVIDRQPATFTEKLPYSLVESGAKIMRNLNENQQRAVLKALTANEYILIKGMPGTGKTQTLVALIKLLHEIGSSVLITAHTHSAVDNILLKLLDDGVDFLRLGSSTSIHSSLKYKSEEYVTANCHSPESLDALYTSKNIVGVTCYGAHHILLGRRTFDVCIVDESAQAMQPTVLRPLYSARKFVLAGDPDQLPPIVRSKTARKLGADESLFVRLDSANNTVNLTKQYRMNKYIMRLANKLTYCDNLEVGSKAVENAALNAPCIEILARQERWIQKVFSRNISDSVIMLNTGHTHDLKVSHTPKLESDQLYSNIWEAAIILRLVETSIQIGVKPKNIGVIAPYRSHVALLRKTVQNDVEVNTVDQYQGRDKEVIFYSCARSLTKKNETSKELEILEDHRRLTVAITRAKHKLIVVANKYTLMQYTPFKKLFDSIEENSIVNLDDGCDDFSWEKLVSALGAS